MTPEAEFAFVNGLLPGVSEAEGDRYDVAVGLGRIVDIRRTGRSDQALPMLDVDGAYILPGLVDPHGHFFAPEHPASIDADIACLPAGVTAAVDGGSSGWSTFEAFVRGAIAAQTVDAYAYINLSSTGLLLPVAAGVGELQDLRHVRPSEIVAAIERHRDEVVGVKVRVDESACGDNALAVIDLAREVAEFTGTRVMAHISGSPIPLERTLERLVAGDVVTHVFHSGRYGILSRHGSVHSAVWNARERGVIFDVGYGAIPSMHFDRSVARAAIADGFLPDTLSTDRIRTSYDRWSPDLVHVMNQFLSIGMPIQRVFEAVTSAAARAIGKQEVHGYLEPGRWADVAILEHSVVDGLTRLRCAQTMKKGQLVWTPNSHLTGDE